jgi:hypothetical protein
MKYIHFIFLAFTIGCSSTYENISLPVYFSSDDSGLGWGIKLNQDSTFNYGDGLAGCLGGSYSKGHWYQNGDTIVLNTSPIPNIKYIEESKEIYNGKLKIYVFGADTNNFDVSHIYYDKHDENELLIRILSFGPVIKVLEPDNFLQLVKERVRKQSELLENLNCKCINITN